MSFLAITKENITDDENKFHLKKCQIFLSPAAQIIDTNYPIVWLDLHLADEGYEICGEDKKLEFKKNGISTVSIPAGLSVRFRTLERIGLSNDLTAIVVNSAGNAVKGLFIAPGKIDPGFAPNKLTLVITNNSRKAIYIEAGSKIATIAFGCTSVECAPTSSMGWAERKIEIHYSPNRCDRLFNSLRNFDYMKYIGQIIMTAITVIITILLTLYVTGILTPPKGV